MTDEGFNLDVVGGLRRRAADIDIETAQEAFLLGLDNPAVLAYAKDHDRILLTHDVNTMPGHFARFVHNLPEGEHTPGVTYLAQTLAISVAIDAIYLVWAASTHDEWRDQETYLP
jgi:hypothetical protein